MKIYILTKKPTSLQLKDMLEALADYIKLAVDTKKKVVAGGGVMHADCEEVLLKKGSRQVDVWGADWYPKEKRVEFGSLINIRPRQGNRTMELKDTALRKEVESVIREIFE
jgi:hypothetical protein